MASWRSQIARGLAVAAALVGAAVCAEGVHDYASDVLGAPHPATAHLPAWAAVAYDWVLLAFFVTFCRLARARLDAWPLAWAVLVVGALYAALSETLRYQIVVDMLANGVGGVRNNLAYMAVSWLPGLLDGLAVGLLTALVARGVAPRSLLLTGLALILAAGAFYAVHQHSGAVADALYARLHLAEPPVVIQPPYVGFPLFVVLVSYTEAALAAFAIVALAWPRLPGATLGRIAMAALLVAGMRGRLGQFLLYSFWVDQPFAVRFLSTGQFLLELLVLGALVSGLWAFVSHSSQRPSRPERPPSVPTRA